MTTDPQNTITRSGLKLNPEHAATDTNQPRLFRVVLHVTELRRVVVEVFAETEADAATNAECLQAEALEQAESVDVFGEAVFVHEVQDEGHGDE